MKNKKVLVLLVVMVLLIGSIAVYAIEYFVPEPKAEYIGHSVPEDTNTMTARFHVTEDFVDLPDVAFSMMSDDGELVIHIGEDTIIYFEDYVPMSDDPADGYTQMVRDELFGRTLAEVLDGRNMVVTYDITTRSIPPQTSPISIMILFEDIVTLPEVIEMP